MYSKRCPKNSHSSFYLKEVVFKKPLESPYIWTNFKSNLDAKNLKKSPNLVTLLVGSIKCKPQSVAKYETKIIQDSKYYSFYDSANWIIL